MISSTCCPLSVTGDRLVLIPRSGTHGEFDHVGHVHGLSPGGRRNRQQAHSDETSIHPIFRFMAKPP
ncbi:MAG: hypothetical protein MZV70_49585 [Desulfobacterales bacterium]|nr:hypothetical protein [Desulfobacterales bacterium]